MKCSFKFKQAAGETPSSAMLASLPSEVVQHILFLLATADPTANLAVLQPVLTTCRSLSAQACATALHARIFRNKFDAAAVERRSFRPTPAALQEQLHWACNILAQVRRGVPAPLDRALQLERFRTNTLAADEVYPEETLMGALLLMLDNDGRNFVQLEAAGIHDYLDAFMRMYFWEGAGDNDGWPVETLSNACALWLVWLTMDRNRLLAASPAQRADFLVLIKPFVFLAHKYPSSQAPPNHFDLPLSPDTPTVSTPLPNTTSTSFYPEETQGMHGARTQHYPHYLPHRSQVVPYFSASPEIVAPLASTAAKLIYVAYRELMPIMIPPHLPLNREDARQRWWAEQLAVDALVQQGMDQTHAMQQVAVAPFPDPLPVVPPHVLVPDLGPTQEDYRTLNRDKAAVLPRGARWDWELGRPIRVNREENDVDDDDFVEGESKKWDTLWWRMRLCGDLKARQPRFMPGAVYDRGSMRGIWKGKLYIPNGDSLAEQIYDNPQYPGNPVPEGGPFFTERSLHVIMQPFSLQIEEHVRICGCSNRSSKRQCGVIPVPLPASIDWRSIPFTGANPDDLPAGHPQHAPLPQDHDQNPADEVMMDSTGDHERPTLKLDYSMSNAWLPGGLGGFTSVSRPANAFPDIQQRNELLVSVIPTPPSNLLHANCPAFLPEGTPLPDPVPGHYVYETYDPARTSAHDIVHEPASYKGPSSLWDIGPAGIRVGGAKYSANEHGEIVNPDCTRCMELEEARKIMRQQNMAKTSVALDRRARRARIKEGTRLLDEAMSVWGSSSEGSPPAGFSIEPFDVRELGMDSDDEMDYDESEDEAESEGQESDGVYGGYGTPARWDESRSKFLSETRPDFARERVTTIKTPCSHAGDTLFTGETPEAGLVWSPKYTTYGRLRPWDGLVGLVRVGSSLAQNFIFIFGYVVAARTFVGEWRMAATDPMRPAWGGTLVMSRIPEENQ